MVVKLPGCYAKRVKIMQIISGSSNKLLAKKIAENTGYRLLNTEIRNFSDGELRVEIQDRIEKDVAIVQSTSSPVNDHLMELLLLIDTAKRAGAENIIGIANPIELFA